jgi:hypothetical protein
MDKIKEVFRNGILQVDFWIFFLTYVAAFNVYLVVG